MCRPNGVAAALVTVRGVTRDDLLRLIELGNAGELDDGSMSADELLMALEGWRGTQCVRTTVALHALLALREGVRARHGDGAAELVERLMPRWDGELAALVETAIALAG